MSFLEVDAAEQYEERRAQRHASLLAAHRSGRFKAFLDQAADDNERALRYLTIEGDVRAVVAAVCEECASPNADAIYDAVEQRLAGGAFCDNCRKWKQGPKALCQCDGEPTLMEDATSAVGTKGSSRTAGPWQVPSGLPPVGDDSGASPSCANCRGTGKDLGQRCGWCNGTGREANPEMAGAGAPMAGTGGPIAPIPGRMLASESTGLSDKPSGPKMDKSKAGDEWSHKTRTPIDTDGGPYKTRHQDVAEPADYTKDSFLDQTDQVAKHGEDVTKGTETSGEKGPHTDTWHGKGNQAKPVTSHFLTEAQIKEVIGE